MPGQRVLRTSAKAKASSSKGGQASLHLEASVPGRQGSLSRANVTISGVSSATVSVSVPEGKKRDRRNDLLLIRDGGESFRIIDKVACLLLSSDI
ncbi:hypothetical protein HU200_030489 [Digitaria exilis]|uniref:Uncharacterized protein n=1 Tax=Digitaria exilis TaxID=1010633 RepID=A0A835EQQ6_9POAL|nr:hypothetical protein HU200_030489 [Digitaria exilis]